MADRSNLRPIERRVLAMTDAGYTEAEIARRFQRGPRFIEQVLHLARLDGRRADRRRAGALRPVERRILHCRDHGITFDVLAERFRRSPDFVARVERLARYKLRRAARR